MAGVDSISYKTLSPTSNMDFHNQDKKDISKVFAFLRSKLNAKEKELLELQRAEPCLLAPDCEQINILIDAISSLHLSTQDGSFLFASNSDNSSSSSCSTSTCSTGVDSIKTLPSTIWLPESVPEKPNDYRLPMVTHLLSLPVSAFVASSSNSSTLSSIKSKDEPSNRLPMVSQLLSMPLSAFKSSSSNDQLIKETLPTKIEDKKQIINNNNNNFSSKSIFESEPIYSKEHWLRQSSSTSDSDFESITLDLDAYIEQSTDKMRRLHMEYLEAMEKLKTPTQQVDSSQMIKTIYPEIFDRMKKDVSTKTSSSRIFPSN
ncbi:unnamed protein product [Adineta steineri]|uniref:Uncharacterized protein n=1 Tax=Adineta steineri TaxID=433720 RepID=A0A815M7S1_9BILA|nr:unnamed protein product [Adineta steineri]CAF4087512.1 unnamed protein product [Adineta steineri]